VRARVHLHVDAEFVATHYAARRMNEIHMAGIAFGIKRPLNDERSFVMALDETSSPRTRCGPFC